MATEEDRQRAEKFLRKMDAGDLDDDLLKALGTLTSDQRFELVRLLIERDANNESNSA